MTILQNACSLSFDLIAAVDSIGEKQWKPKKSGRKSIVASVIEYVTNRCEIHERRRVSNRSI